MRGSYRRHSMDQRKQELRAAEQRLPTPRHRQAPSLPSHTRRGEHPPSHPAHPPPQHTQPPAVSTWVFSRCSSWMRRTFSLAWSLGFRPWRRMASRSLHTGYSSECMAFPFTCQDVLLRAYAMIPGFFQRFLNFSCQQLLYEPMDAPKRDLGAEMVLTPEARRIAELLSVLCVCVCVCVCKPPSTKAGHALVSLTAAP